MGWAGLAMSVVVTSLEIVKIAIEIDPVYRELLGELSVGPLSWWNFSRYMVFTIVFLSFVGTFLAPARRICIVAGLLLLAPGIPFVPLWALQGGLV